MQQKTGRSVQFEITEQTRVALVAWIHDQKLKPDDILFPVSTAHIHLSEPRRR